MNVLKHIHIGPLHIHFTMTFRTFWIPPLSPDNVEYRRRSIYASLSNEIGWIKAVRDLSPMNIKQAKQWVADHDKSLWYAYSKYE